MAKTAKAKVAPPDHLEVSLFDPEMDLLLRAGIGGLATTLRWIERSIQSEQYDEDDFPESWIDDGVPWELSSDKILFRFADPEKVEDVFKPIFQAAFGLCERTIDLQTTYLGKQQQSVRVNLQRGLMLTFLQHGKTRTGEKKDSELNIEIDGKSFQFSTRCLDWYKHQDGYQDLIDKKKGTLSQKSAELPGTLYPGAAVRHNGFAGQTKYEGSVSQLLAAYFAPIGTLALPINRGSAVLLVPDVQDLLLFADNRRKITPSSYRDCLIGGSGDAVLQLYARLRGDDTKQRLAVASVTAFVFRPTAWASQQKSRVAAEKIEPLDQRRLEIFRYAKDHFAPRKASRKVTVKTGKGKAAKSTEREEFFWSDSIVRPLIADNLAHRRDWFTGFTKLFVDRDPANGKPFRDRLPFERTGLIAMIKADVWDKPGQMALIGAVHHALRGRYGQIASETANQKAAMQNRFRGEYERWRLAFSGAKTADQFRHSICDLFSRVPANKELQANWTEVLPWLDESGWQHARDLALLALASYQGKGAKELAAAAEASEDADSASA
ncbi:CRISPR-associated protein Cas8a1/Csx13 [Novipirellula aureliae]|uniref:CRISPR-associated protein Cas8a1/Csx13 n=1 Tax=Novipirellula aureliae TaxID=2527966 RepID=A0A5C6E5N4_9BACT|nr:type I-MYXAN CRISPR-associated Cas8a1/Cmx1 [Novipirellula aureliae]TWU43854.1 CRISPR-associated protein Cas8a1/Csx13 [Novipirellula aureliae]